MLFTVLEIDPDRLAPGDGPGQDRGHSDGHGQDQGHTRDRDHDHEGGRLSGGDPFLGREVGPEGVGGQEATGLGQGHRDEDHRRQGHDDAPHQGVVQDPVHHTSDVHLLPGVGTIRPITKKTTDIHQANRRRRVRHHSPSPRMNMRCLKNTYSKFMFIVTTYGKEIICRFCPSIQAITFECPDIDTS